MVQVRSGDRRKKVCERVKQIRIKYFGDKHGSQKEMAKALGIPYTTYRGYEENRTNDEFIKHLAEKFNVSPLWILWGDESDWKANGIEGPVVIDPGIGALKSGKYKLLQMPDESMEPTIKKGAWVGIESMTDDEDVSGKIIGFWGRDGKLMVRRATQRGKNILVVTDHPGHIDEITTIGRKDIVGKVVWQFTNL